MAEILLVEDDTFLIEALKALLESDGHNVTTAENGQVATELLKQRKFDCVLSDLQMPVMSGADLVLWINENCPTPVILMTGFADAKDVSRAEKAGVAQIMRKPFSLADILNKIVSAVGKPK